MNITFTGLKNIGGLQVNQIIRCQKGFADGYMDEENSEYRQFTKYMNVNCQLTNYDGNDLDRFEKILRKYPNQINKNFITLEYTPHGFYLNSKALPVNDDNLWIFESLVKLLDKKLKDNTDNFGCDIDYLDSEDSKIMLIPKAILDSASDANELAFLLHQPDHAKAVMRNMAEEIDKRVCDYLA